MGSFKADRSVLDASDTVPDLPDVSDESRVSIEPLPNEISGTRVRPDATVKGLGPDAQVVYTLQPRRLALPEDVRRPPAPADEHFTWLQRDQSFVRTMLASVIGLVACVLLLLFGGSEPGATAFEAERAAAAAEVAPEPVVAKPRAPISAPAPVVEPVAKAAPFPEAELPASAKIGAKKKVRPRLATRVSRTKTGMKSRASAKPPKRLRGQVGEPARR